MLLRSLAHPSGALLQAISFGPKEGRDPQETHDHNPISSLDLTRNTDE